MKKKNKKKKKIVTESAQINSFLKSEKQKSNRPKHNSEIIHTKRQTKQTKEIKEKLKQTKELKEKKEKNVKKRKENREQKRKKITKLNFRDTVYEEELTEEEFLV